MYDLIFLKFVCEAMGFLQPGTTFLQIGANDGVSNDVCGPLVRKYGWQGQAFEPIPEIFDQLVQTYKNFPAVRPHDLAVGTDNGRAIFYKVNHPIPAAQQLGSFSKGGILKHADSFQETTGMRIEDAIVEIEVDTISINNVFKEMYPDGVNCIFSDTEGNDWEIINSIDFQENVPDVIYFETAHCSKPEEEMAAFFSSVGYSLYCFPTEAIAVRDEAAKDEKQKFDYAFDVWNLSEQQKRFISLLADDGTYVLNKTGNGIAISKN